MKDKINNIIMDSIGDMYEEFGAHPHIPVLSSQDVHTILLEIQSKLFELFND